MALKQCATASTLFSAALAFIFFGVLTSTSRIWQINGPLLIPSGSYALIPAVILCAIAAFLLRGDLKRLTLCERGFTCGLLLVFISDWFDRSYNFFPNPFVRGEVLCFGILFVLLSPTWRSRVILWALPLTVIYLATTFLLESDGKLLYSDDHPSFLFRLSMLKEEFPHIPFYYPYWNAGMDARDFFATGSLGGFLLFSPLIYLFEVADIYNFIIALILFGVLPVSVFLAARIEQLPRLAQAIAPLLALCLGLVWYRWALKYGTMGFILSSALIPLNLALALRLLMLPRESTLKIALFFVITFTIMLFWTPSGLVFIPLGVIGLAVLSVRLWHKTRPLFGAHLLVAGALIILINVPWLVVFWSVSSVGRFLDIKAAPRTEQIRIDQTETANLAAESAAATLQEGRHRGFRNRAGELKLSKSLAVVREKAIATNPLILFFALPGLFLLRRSSRIPLALILLWLLFLGSILVPLKPQLELDRMLVIASLIATLPSAAALTRLLEAEGKWLRVLQATAAGFLFVSALCTGAILANRTVDQYHFADSLVNNLATAIRELGGKGRTVFAGCVVHELEDGHLAPLPLWSGKELVASAPFHTLWRYTQVVPHSFMQRGDAGIEEFLTFMNATSVVTHDREWREYFSSRPEKYQLVWREDRFSLFERLQAVDEPFLEGSGKVVGRSNNSLRVRIDSPHAVLKYSYFPFLEAHGPSECVLSAAEVAPELRFIRFDGCAPNTEVEIRAAPVWRRVLG